MFLGTKKELIEYIQRRYPDNDDPLMVDAIWNKQDVLGQVDNLSDEDIEAFASVPFKQDFIMEVLETMEDRHDCNFGTTWETIDSILLEKLEKYR